MVTLTKKEKCTFFYGTKPASHPLVTLIRAYQKVSIVDRKGGTYVRYYVHNIGLDNVTHTKELKRRETSTKRKSTYSPQKSTTFTKDKGNVHLKRAVPFLGQKKSFSCDIIISLTSHLQSREFGFHVLWFHFVHNSAPSNWPPFLFSVWLHSYHLNIGR